MTENGSALKLEKLKRSFDQGFQEAGVERDQTLVHLLTIRIATEKFALPVAELAGLARASIVVRLPAAIPGLLGLAGVKGRMVAVYSLAKLVGCEGVGPDQECWSVLCRPYDRIALAFAATDGTLMVPRSTLNPVGPGAPSHVTDTVGSGSSPHWLLSIESLVEAIASQTRVASPASVLVVEPQAKE